MKMWVFYKISPRATISPTSHLVHSALKAFEWWLISFIGDVRDSDTTESDDEENIHNNINRYEVFYVLFITWDLSKNVHGGIFGPKILHTKIVTIFPQKETA